MRSAGSVLFITGAGVSADSGLPTYRGVGGLYEQGTTSEGLPIEVALSGDMLRARPELCWKYIHQIERACRDARANAAHEVIASLQASVERGWVLTQNVDGFHAQVGSESLIEIHGNLRRLRCMQCDWEAEVESYAGLESQLGTASAPTAPRCPRCNGGVRPDVVLFGEMLPRQALMQLEQQLRIGFDLVVSVGTTSAFPYIAAPVLAARRAGKATVEINPGDTEVSEHVDLRIRAGAKDTFTALAEVLGR